MNREVPVAMGMPMKGFFNEVDIVAKAMASASVAAHGAPVLQFLHPSLFLLRKVPKPRGLVSLFLFLSRFLLPKKKSLL